MLFFTVHKVTIVFRFHSDYVRQYTASQSIKPKVVSIWLFTGKKICNPCFRPLPPPLLKTYSPEKLWITRVILLFHMQERNLCIINPKYVMFYFKSHVGLPFKLRPLFKVNLLILSTPYRISNNTLKQNICKLRKPNRKKYLKRSCQEGMGHHFTYRGIPMIIIADISSETTLQKKKRQGEIYTKSITDLEFYTQ